MSSSKSFVVYDPITGCIQGSGYGTVPEEGSIIFGFGQEPTHYVDVSTKKIVEKPPKLSFGHQWDYSKKEWNLDSAALDRMHKIQRSEMLASSDWTQLPDVPLDTKNAWLNYRQSLRDITAQEGYPFNVVWPVPPGK